MALYYEYDVSQVEDKSQIGVYTDKNAHFDLKKFRNFYILNDPSTAASESIKEDMQKKYPITKKMAIYVLDGNSSQTQKIMLEGFIKDCCPDYTYEDLDEDHLEVGYESTDVSPPLFKMALEYTLDEYGVSVRLPANGIRFNETLYRLDSIEILPYMGAGNNSNSGNTFYPDGSGTLFNFEDVKELGTSVKIKGKVYGQDFAYHTLEEGSNVQPIRYPIFGLSETVNGKDRGFVAIVEEGDALMEISAEFDPTLHPYNNTRITVYPRPKDTYNLSDAGGSSNSTWTVVSDRKYTGNYKVRYVMLTDDDLAAEKGLEKYYSCNYMGMANAYRDYLVRNGILTRLTSEDVNANNIPVYIETFGAIETTKRVLSIPVKTMVSLTSFENIKTMHQELSAAGVNNINFILTGYNKGGLSEPTYPNRIKWEDSVGGKEGFEDLMTYAKEQGVGIFPDFDFVFYANDSAGDGLSLKKHAVKTIDNRYTSKRVYNSTKQTYMSYYELAISPAYYHVFYEKLTEDYLEYAPTGISVSTLGEYLNSDFDEDEPYNREDSKAFTIEMFKYLENNYENVMTSKGNAYSWGYVDYITDIALDSSRYSQASASIPFLGLVLHGYVQLAGTPINMEGNTDYALLKAIENGASLKFILSYENTSLLKNDEILSENFSVRYDIWYSDIVEMYTELNALLAGVQTSIITDHKFIEGDRVPDKGEILTTLEDRINAAIKLEDDLLITAEDEARQKLLDARKQIYKNESSIAGDYKSFAGYRDAIYEYIKLITFGSSDRAVYDADLALRAACIEAVALAQAAYDAKKAEYDAIKGDESVSAEDKAAKLEEVNAAKAACSDAEAALLLAEAGLKRGYKELVALAALYTADAETAKAAYDAKKAEYDAMDESVSDDDKAAKLAEVNDAKAAYDALVAIIDELNANAAAQYETISSDASIILTTRASQLYTSYYKMKAAAEQSVANMAYLTENSGFSAEFLAEIATYVTPVVDTFDLAYADVKGTDGVEAMLVGLKESLAEINVTVNDFVVPAEPTTSEPPKRDTTTVDTRYHSDDNKIVLLTYENGTRFILNFNSFDITTTINGVVYSVDAYGYVVLK